MFAVQKHSLLTLVLFWAFFSGVHAASVSQSQSFVISTVQSDSAIEVFSFQPFDSAQGDLNSISWFLENVTANAACIGGAPNCIPASTQLSIADPYGESSLFGSVDMSGTEITQFLGTGDLLNNQPPRRDPFLGNDSVFFNLSVSESDNQTISGTGIFSSWNGNLVLNYVYRDSSGIQAVDTQSQAFVISTVQSDSSIEVFSFQPFDSTQGELISISWFLENVTANAACIGGAPICIPASTQLSIADPYGESSQFGSVDMSGTEITQFFGTGDLLNNQPPRRDPFLGNDSVFFNLLVTELDDQTISGTSIFSSWNGDLTLLYDFTETATSLPSAIPIPGAVWLFGSALIGIIGLNSRRKIKVAINWK